MIKTGNENKPHIGIYGRCNSGKSSLLNFITGGDISLVSHEPGTTTDPVRKSFEIQGFAPVVFIDTAGLDDDSELGAKRVARTLDTLALIDLAILVFAEWGDAEESLVARFRKEGIPYVTIYNDMGAGATRLPEMDILKINIREGDDHARNAVLEAVKECLPERSYLKPSMFGGMVGEGEVVVLVCPIDSGAPAGRLILPQVQAIRDLLDKKAVCVTVQPSQVGRVFAMGLDVRMVVTDSQAFAEVAGQVPQGVELTSFSILLAQLKGDLELYREGLMAIDPLRPGDKILILENCTHQSSCDDIGRVKIPALMEEYLGYALDFTVVTGFSPLPDDLPSYSLAVQCGGCMVTASQLRNRIRAVSRAGVPVTNYGMCLKFLQLSGEK